MCVCVCTGVCLGLQVAVIEFARSVLEWKDAHSTEFNKTTTHPMVHMLLQWNLSNPDTIGTEESVLISEVS